MDGLVGQSVALGIFLGLPVAAGSFISTSGVHSAHKEIPSVGLSVVVAATLAGLWAAIARPIESTKAYKDSCLVVSSVESLTQFSVADRDVMGVAQAMNNVRQFEPPFSQDRVNRRDRSLVVAT
jgi:hypothetical protein